MRVLLGDWESAPPIHNPQIKTGGAVSSHPQPSRSPPKLVEPPRDPASIAHAPQRTRGKAYTRFKPHAPQTVIAADPSAYGLPQNVTALPHWPTPAAETRRAERRATSTAYPRVIGKN